MNSNYTTSSTENELPYVLGAGSVRRIAREIADYLIAEARAVDGPVAWVTGSLDEPPLREFPGAERVWNAENNDDGGLFTWLSELIEDHLSDASVILGPPGHNKLYVVDLRRWEFSPGEATGDDPGDEWKPVDLNWAGCGFTRETGS
jgi:hypothetical protein